MKEQICPNCMSQIVGHPQDGCVLAAMIGVIKDRGELSEKNLWNLWANCDVDRFWDDVAQVVHDLEQGEYSFETNK